LAGRDRHQSLVEDDEGISPLCIRTGFRAIANRGQDGQHQRKGDANAGDSYQPSPPFDLLGVEAIHVFEVVDVDVVGLADRSQEREGDPGGEEGEAGNRPTQVIRDNRAAKRAEASDDRADHPDGPQDESGSGFEAP
jgi:hypothetical protein